MSELMEGKWAYASSEEGPFYGEFASAEEAVLECFGWEEGEDKDDAYLGQRCYVGEMSAPSPASDYLDGDDIIERIANDHEHYNGDWADSWPGASKEQIAELTDVLRAAFDAWESKHNLKPRFFVIESSESMSVREAIERCSNTSKDQSCSPTAGPSTPTSG